MLSNIASAGSCTTPHAAAAADGRQPGRAVVQHPGQDHPCDPRAVRLCRGAEQRIDRRPAAVLARAADDAHPIGAHQEVPVGRRQRDHAVLDRLHVLGEPRREASAALEDRRQRRRDGRR
jgi:hypothetical protein